MSPAEAPAAAERIEASEKQRFAVDLVPVAAETRGRSIRRQLTEMRESDEVERLAR